MLHTKFNSLYQQTVKCTFLHSTNVVALHLTKAVNFSKINSQTPFQNDTRTLSTVPASPVHTTFHPCGSSFKKKIHEQEGGL